MRTSAHANKKPQFRRASSVLIAGSIDVCAQRIISNAGR
jgi:hypothetical protein